MVERSALAQTLTASAPTRDFLRPAQRSGQRITHALAPLVAKVEEAHLVAAVAFLLGVHGRHESVALAVRRHGKVIAFALELRPRQAFHTLVAQARKRLLQTDQGQQGTAEDESTTFIFGKPSLAGVLIDLDCSDGLSRDQADDEASLPEADFVLRRSAQQLDADADLYRADSLPPLARLLAHLLGSTSTQTDTVLSELSLCDASERQRVLRGFNSLRLTLPSEASFASLIAAQLAARDPDAICAVHGASALSWAELDARSNRLAHKLLACGVGPGRYVALLERRSLDFVVALVAIWKAGGAYIPMDPAYPAERIRTMLSDSDVAVAIVGAEMLARFRTALQTCSSLRHVLCQQSLDGPQPQVEPDSYTLHGPDSIQACAAAPLVLRAQPRDPAYMLYTSGSTGRPKGAIVRHDGAVNHLFAEVHALGRDTVARFLQSAPSSSDISVWQFAAPLALGGTTVIVDDATDVARVLAEVRRHRVHLVELVPTVFKYLIDYAAALPAEERALPSLRYAMVTGEAASVDLVNAWLALYPEIPIVNAYGPTEAADDISQAVITAPLPPRQASVPIGRPLANLDLHVLDDKLRPLPVGAWGEICVAGIGVGDGYWRQPEKTQAAFVANPFAADPDAAGAVLYRTGDIGRWRDDGSLECAGRVDHQVQVRGQRIELPEIEAALRQHPGVADAVVQVFQDDDDRAAGARDAGHAGNAGAAASAAPGRGYARLVAFIVPAAGIAVDDDALRGHLAARLPVGMLPAAYVRLAALPLNPAGKVDRRALRAPAPARVQGSDGGRAPRNPLETLLARLWCEELRLDSIGIDADFFALGGDSMSALAISVAAREAGWQLRSADVLAAPSIARLAKLARPVTTSTAAEEIVSCQATAELEDLSDAPRAVQSLAETTRASFLAAHPAWADVRALTPAQQSLLVHWLLARDKRCYVDQLGYRLEGELDPDAFKAAWQATIDRHAALRAGFLRSALAQPVQVTAHTAAVELAFLDLGALDAEAQAKAWAARCRAEIDAGFDLAAPPLMRLVLARLSPRRHLLAWTHHHLLLDGWSIAIVLQDVLALHAAAQEPGRAAAALPPVVDDAAYHRHLARADLQPGLQHWARMLAGAPRAPAWREAEPAAPAPGFGETDLELSVKTTAALRAAAARFGVTLGTLLQAAWAALITRHTGCTDVVFGVVSSGRELPVSDIGRMVGLFVVTQALRADTRPSAGLLEWLAGLQQQAAAVRLHEAVPLNLALRTAALPPGQPLFETLIVLWNFPGLDNAPPGPLAIRPTHYRTVPAYPLTLIAVPGETLQLRLVHDRQRFGDAAIAAFRRTLQEALERLSAQRDPRPRAPA